MDFVSWFKGGIAELTPDDIARCEKDLNPKYDDEKQLGTVDGDLLKLWAFICKDDRAIRRDLWAHEKKCDDAPEHGDACHESASELIARTNRHKILTEIFWHDVRAFLGKNATPTMALRKGMVIVKDESPETRLRTLVGSIGTIRPPR